MIKKLEYSDKEYWTYMTCKRITDFINTLIPERSENENKHEAN